MGLRASLSTSPLEAVLVPEGPHHYGSGTRSGTGPRLKTSRSGLLWYGLVGGKRDQIRSDRSRRACGGVRALEVTQGWVRDWTRWWVDRGRD